MITAARRRRHRIWMKIVEQPELYCPTCLRNKGSTSFPCPFCSPKKPRKKNRSIRPPLDEDSVKVRKRYRSKSQPGEVHELRADKNGTFKDCSCRGYFYRKECRHMKEWISSHPWKKEKK